MKHISCILIALLVALCVQAQVGYQVALMDQSTGKPRANETVSVTVTISDNAGTVICSETSSATTNQFGMLALQVGNASTFDTVDWNKAPLWVSAIVGGVTIGKTQILNVPVAEHAKHWGELTPEILASKTWSNGFSSLRFSNSGSCNYSSEYDSYNASYIIYGSTVCTYDAHQSNQENIHIYQYLPQLNALAQENQPALYK